MGKESYQNRLCGIVPVRIKKNDHQYLLVQALNGSWGFPKGHKNPGESDLQTALREFSEETGMKLKKVFEENSLTEKYVLQRANKKIPITVVYFLAIPENGEVKPQAEEVQSYAWLNFNAAYEHLSFPERKMVLEKAEEELVRLKLTRA